MDLEQAEQIISEKLPNQELLKIEDYNAYFVFTVKTPGMMDATHMINKQTGEVRPFNPTLIQQGEPK